MARHEVLIFFCDLCGKEDGVQTHRVTVDNHELEVDACERCWQSVLASIAVVDRVGRTPQRKRRGIKKADLATVPGQDWQFTHHALVRCGERKISPAEIVKAIEEPETTTPGNQPDTEVRIGAGMKAVVNPDRRVVLTVAYRDEDMQVA